MTVTLIFLAVLLVGYVLIATGHLTGVNRAAVAVFLGTAGWVVYVCWGADFVGEYRPVEYYHWSMDTYEVNHLIKHYIEEDVFLPCVGRVASLVIYLIATRFIVELLGTNGCFDFIVEWIRTRHSRRLLWTMSVAAYLLSATLDNLTTTTMMLVIMHRIVRNTRQRWVLGSAIVIAANAGGCLTVIGDAAGLILWTADCITATRYAAYMLLPTLAGWGVAVFSLSTRLPQQLDVEWKPAPYRGGETRLNRWQRLVMLVVGLGGLWLVPTFYDVTKLAPFLGALCVLSVLWVVNEAFNRKLMRADQMAVSRLPLSLQWSSTQQVLFVMGIMLAIGALNEMGAWAHIEALIPRDGQWVLPLTMGAGVLSMVGDTFTVVTTFMSIQVLDYAPATMADGAYWLLLPLSTALGGSVLMVGSMSGLALMSAERVSFGWYVRNVAVSATSGWLAGLSVLIVELYWL